jgi:hypothetical protein
MRGILLALLLLAAPAAASAQATTSLKVVNFRMPSKNIHCQYRSESPAGLRCDIFSRLRPPPNARCTEGVWSAVTMTRTGKARPICISDTVYTPKSPVLAYGRTWKVGGFTCKSQRVGLTCRNLAGHGFFLSRQSWRTY